MKDDTNDGYNPVSKKGFVDSKKPISPTENNKPDSKEVGNATPVFKTEPENDKNELPAKENQDSEDETKGYVPVSKRGKQ